MKLREGSLSALKDPHLAAEDGSEQQELAEDGGQLPHRGREAGHLLQQGSAGAGGRQLGDRSRL